jgi:hypothetical protein
LEGMGEGGSSMMIASPCHQRNTKGRQGRVGPVEAKDGLRPEAIGNVVLL